MALIEIPWLGEYLYFLPLDIQQMCIDYSTTSCSVLDVEYILSQAKDHNHVGLLLQKESVYMYHTRERREKFLRDAKILKWEHFIDQDKYSSNQHLVNVSEEILVALHLNDHQSLKHHYIQFVPGLAFQLKALELEHSDEREYVSVDAHAIDLFHAIRLLEQGRTEQSLSILRKSLQTWEFRYTFTGD